MAFVSATVAATVLALTSHLIRHRSWRKPDLEAYNWFLWFTSLVWIFSTTRYVAVGFGYAGRWISYIDILVQAAVFLGGPALFGFLVLRVTNSKTLANTAAAISFAMGIVALGFALGPSGIPLNDVTNFSAEATVNIYSFRIFGVEILLLAALCLYDIIHRLRQRSTTNSIYDALLAAPLLVYVLIGSVDEAKVITGWPLVVFRLLYVAGFLFLYLIITQEEARDESSLFISQTEAYAEAGK